MSGTRQHPASAGTVGRGYVVVFPSLHRDPLVRHLPPADERPVAGVECEYRLVDDSGRPADARVHLGPRLADLPHLDPGDPRAVRLDIGSALTCDGWEAEAVTPPLPWGPTTGSDLTECVAATRAALLRILAPDSFAVQGFSTHLNVTVPDRRAVAVARDIARRCSVAVALLTEGRSGDGLLVRPRRGRLEVGCDHLEDRMITPATTLLAGVVALLQHRPSRLPRLDVAVQPAREKFGFYVGLDAAGGDLLRSGRGTVLRTRRGARLSAQDHLEQVWSAARPYAEAHGLALAETDAVVSGSTPLASESGAPPTWTTSGTAVSASTRRWGVDLDPRVRPAGSAGVAWATWDTTAWRCASDAGTARFAVVPRSRHAGFVAELDAGRLDALLFSEGPSTPPREAPPARRTAAPRRGPRWVAS
ncbi:hypothetical protein [Oryzobacter terrae]|uniref:hypothetical protein n=1 Tax=Oryzobacter terrae TaxID=1620385 RepID=UPI00366F1FF5